MRRIFLAFSAGIALCAAVCCYLVPAPSPLFAAAAGFCAVFFGALAAVAGIRDMRLFSAFAAGICIVSLLMSADSRSHADRTAWLCDGMTVTAEAADFPTERLFNSAVHFELTSPSGTKTDILVYLPGLPEISPGDTVRLTLSFSDSETSAYLRSQGYDAAAFCSDWSTVGHRGLTFSNAPEYLRQAVLDGCDRVFGSRSGFYSALLFGDKSGLDSEFIHYSAASGTAHIYAVSGLHTSFIVSAILFLAGRRRRYVSAVAIPVLILFTAAGGFSPSLVRSAIMYSIVLLGYSVRREPDTLVSTMVALTAIILHDPWAVTDIRLQFSFAAVFSLITVGSRLSARFSARPPKGGTVRKYLTKTVGRTLCSTLSVQFGTLPLTVIYFSSVSTVAVIANILILPVISAVFIGGLAALLLEFVWHLPALAIACAVLPGTEYVCFITELLGKLPFASVGTTPAVLIWVIFSYILALLILLFKPPKAILRASLLSVAVLFATVGAERLSRSDSMTLRVVDVGHGQCVMISAGGRTAIVDCGSSSADAAARLSEAMSESNIPSAELLIVTSTAAHHSSGVAKAAELLRIGRTVVCGLSETEPEFDCEQVYTDTLFELGELKIYLLLPLGGEPAAVYAEFNGYSVLIQGDLDTEECEYMLSTRQLTRADVLVAGRHGKAISEKILQTTAPKYVIISGRTDGEYSTASKGDILFIFRNGKIIEGRT